MDPRLLPAEMTKKGGGYEERGGEGMLKNKCAKDAGSEGSRPVNKTKFLVIPACIWQESILISFRRYLLYQLLSMMLFLPYLDKIRQMVPTFTGKENRSFPFLIPSRHP